MNRLISLSPVAPHVAMFQTTNGFCLRFLGEEFSFPEALACVSEPNYCSLFNAPHIWVQIYISQKNIETNRLTKKFFKKFYFSYKVLLCKALIYFASFITQTPLPIDITLVTLKAFRKLTQNTFCLFSYLCSNQLSTYSIDKCYKYGI